MGWRYFRRARREGDDDDVLSLSLCVRYTRRFSKSCTTRAAAERERERRASDCARAAATNLSALREMCAKRHAARLQAVSDVLRDGSVFLKQCLNRYWLRCILAITLFCRLINGKVYFYDGCCGIIIVISF